MAKWNFQSNWKYQASRSNLSKNQKWFKILNIPRETTEKPKILKFENVGSNEQFVKT
jgi:hypothetical protein